MTERLKSTRIDNDETQQELAKALGFHRVQIARYETGENTPPINYIIAFCNHYNVSADYILGLPIGLSWPRIEDVHLPKEPEKTKQKTKEKK